MSTHVNYETESAKTIIGKIKNDSTGQRRWNHYKNHIDHRLKYYCNIERKFHKVGKANLSTASRNNAIKLFNDLRRMTCTHDCRRVPTIVLRLLKPLAAIHFITLLLNKKEMISLVCSMYEHVTCMVIMIIQISRDSDKGIVILQAFYK